MASSPETGSLTVQEVRRMADLAGLELSDDEADRLTSELADIAATPPTSGLPGVVADPWPAAARLAPHPRLFPARTR